MDGGEEVGWGWWDGTMMTAAVPLSSTSRGHPGVSSLWMALYIMGAGVGWGVIITL